jgi:hypothetical protein
MKTETGPYPVTMVDGSDANGVASLLGTLLEQNFVSFPDRVRTARKVPRPVMVHSLDTGEEATLVFYPDRLDVYNGRVGRPSVTVKATVEQVLDVVELKMRRGGLLPVGFFTARGARVLGAMLRHRLVVKGLIRHPVTALAFIALASTVE